MLRFGEPEASDALDAFLGQCLHRGGVWTSPRDGDGIARVRVVERTGSRLRVIGRVWLIDDQSQESFWLDLTRDDEAGDRVSWTLHFGLSSFGRSRPRDLKDAVDLMDAPEQGTWRDVLTGAATVAGGELRLVEIASPAR